MKFRNIITIALASSLVFAACTKEEATDSFEDIKVSSNFLTFSENGESKDIVVTSTQDWKFIVDENFPEVITLKKKDAKDNTISAKHDYYGNLLNEDSDIESRKDSWVKASVLEGKAGETTVKFTVEAYTAGRELTIAILSGTHKQYIVIRQGDLAPVTMTCKEILESAQVGASYVVEGTVTKLGNYSSYGAFYVNDGTTSSDVQIYNSTSQSINDYPNVEVGDKVKFSGTWSSYKNFESVEISELTKALAKVETESHDVEKEGETFDVKISYKGNGLNPAVPEAYQDWISILSVTTKEGTKTKIDKNPADTAFVKIKVAPNQGGDREGQVNFTSSTSGSSSEVYYSFTQKGAIIAATVEEFLAAAEGNIQYRVTGVITKISASSKYHNADITVASGDFTKTVLLYRAKTSEGNIEDLNLAVGDIVTVVGKRSSHNGSAQMAEGGILESYKHYAPATVAEFLAAANDSEFAVTGKIVKVADLSGKSSHNNVCLTIQNGDNSLYLFRVTTYDQSDVAVLNPEVGGTITVAGKRAEYKGAAQMASGGVVLAYTAPTEDGGHQQPEYETVWSEDWSAYKADDVPTDPYTCTGTTKIYAQTLAGGTAPEILVSKNGGTLAVKISDLKGKTGDFRFSFKCNKDFLTVTCSDDVKVTEVTKGKEFTLTVPSNVKTFTVTITNPNSSNARVDDLKLEVKK